MGNNTPDSAASTQPLTGKGGQNNDRPALMVKIDNVRRALPQRGIQQADIIIEEPVEGGLTRLVAIYQSQDPGTIGPVRSARYEDAELTHLFPTPILAYSGASQIENRVIKTQSSATLIVDDWNNAPGVFHRDPTRKGDHSLMLNTTKAWAWAKTHDNPWIAPDAIITYTPENQGAQQTNNVKLNYGATQVQWRWKGKHWVRYQDGKADMTSDQGQVSADTSIILTVETREDAAFHDVLGHSTPLVATTGTGSAWIIRDGQYIQGRWSRASSNSPLNITSNDNQSLGAKPGRTWIELASREQRITVAKPG